MNVMRLSRILILQILLKVSAKECNRINSTCCYNEHFDNNTNDCVVCKNGSIGWNCESSCTTGYYGYLCTTPCECDAQFCDKRTGCHSPQNDTSTIRTNNHTLTIFSTTVFEGTASQEEYTDFTDTSDQKRNIYGMSVPSNNSSIGGLQDFISRPVLFFIGSVTTFFIGGTFIYFRKRFTWTFIDRYQGRTQPLSRTPSTDRDSGYDEIRYSQLIRNSNICAEVRASSSANGMAGYSSKSQYLLSVIYDDFNEDDEDYSRLILRQNQSICIPRRSILLEDEGYAILNSSDFKEFNSDIVVQKHRSLPKFTTIQNQISSTEFKNLTRCMSENNILHFKRLLPISFVFPKQKKIHDDNDKRPKEITADNKEVFVVSS